MIRAVGVTRLVRDPDDPTRGVIETLDPLGAVVASELVEGLELPAVERVLEDEVEELRFALLALLGDENE